MTLENQALHLEVERLLDEARELRTENARLAAERDQYKADYERSHRRCNRMACSADLTDVQWRPA